MSWWPRNPTPSTTVAEAERMLAAAEALPDDAPMRDLHIMAARGQLRLSRLIEADRAELSRRIAARRGQAG